MLLTARDAAALLNTSERQIYRWVDEEEIPFQRVRDQIRFNRSELLEWATSRRMPVSLQAFDADDPDEVAPSLAAALRVGGVHTNVPSRDREQALQASVALTPLPASMDRELLVEVLLAREVTGSTAIGEGIAIPHVRHPVVAPGSHAAVSLCFLATPVEFGAPDGQPVHTIFMIVSPTVREHLQMLARVARALSDPAFRAVLARRGGIDELCSEAARVEEAHDRGRSDPERAGGGSG